MDTNHSPSNASSSVKVAYTPAAPTGDALRAWLRLANLQYTPRLTSALLTRFGGDPRAVFAATDGELDDVPGFQPRHLARLRDAALEPTERQRAWIEERGVRLLLRGLPDYPSRLHEIPDPPPILFARGALSEISLFSAGIVGSRQATPYGRSVAERMARELGEHGLLIVSGGAVGIDTAAHRGAVAAHQPTLAVLGCGLDIDYPRENRALFEQIMQQGALLTEYPLGAQPESWRFPQRNRIISGLSLGVLVVEAPIQSGALNTARYVVEHGRVLMVVPANIDRPSSAGSNELLKDGATPITCVEDILRALNLVVLPARREHQRALELELAEEEAAVAAAPQRAVLHDIPEAQRRLLEGLSQTPRHIDAVAQAAGMTAMQAGVEMTLLELSGFVRRLPGNAYIRLL